MTSHNLASSIHHTPWSFCSSSGRFRKSKINLLPHRHHSYSWLILWACCGTHPLPEHVVSNRTMGTSGPAADNIHSHRPRHPTGRLRCVPHQNQPKRRGKANCRLYASAVYPSWTPRHSHHHQPPVVLVRLKNLPLGVYSGIRCRRQTACRRFISQRPPGVGAAKESCPPAASPTRMPLITDVLTGAGPPVASNTVLHTGTFTASTVPASWISSTAFSHSG